MFYAPSSGPAYLRKLSPLGRVVADQALPDWKEGMAVALDGQGNLFGAEANPAMPGAFRLRNLARPGPPVDLGTLQGLDRQSRVVMITTDRQGNFCVAYTLVADHVTTAYLVAKHSPAGQPLSRACVSRIPCCRRRTTSVLIAPPRGTARRWTGSAPRGGR